MSTHGRKASFLDWLLGRGHTEPCNAEPCDPRIDDYGRAADEIASSADVIARALRTMDRHELPRRPCHDTEGKGPAS